MALVFESHDQAEAEMVVALLEEEGIPARLLGTRNAALLGAATFAFLLQVEVEPAHAERARELLDALVEQESGEIPEDEWRSLPPAGETPTASEAREAPAVPAAVPEAKEAPEVEAPALCTSRSPVVAPLLGLGTLLVVLQWMAGGDLTRLVDLGAQRGPMGPGELYRLVTSSFLHFDGSHLLSNLEGIVVYGWAAISLFGLARTSFAYMLVALSGGLAWLAFGDPTDAAAGASGCVFGLTAMVLIGKLRQVRTARVARWRGWITVVGWALFVVPSAFFFDYVVHLAGLAVGIVLGLVLARVPEDEDAPAFARPGRAMAWAAAALFVLPWGQRLAASFYAPCKTGHADRCWAACEGGDARACHDASLRRIASGDTRSAEVLQGFERACAATIPEACSDLGEQLEWRRDPRATEVLEAACQRGEQRACLRQAEQVGDVASRLGRLDALCERGYAPACLRAGLTYRAETAPGAAARAVSALRRGCDGRQPEACRALGEMYARALGIAGDADEAATLFVRGCALGDTASCEELAARDGSWSRASPALGDRMRRPTPFHFL